MPSASGSLEAHPPRRIVGVEGDFSEIEVGVAEPPPSEGEVFGVEIEGVTGEEVGVDDAVVEHDAGGGAERARAGLHDLKERGGGDRLQIAGAPVCSHSAGARRVLSSIVAGVRGNPFVVGDCFDDDVVYGVVEDCEIEAVGAEVEGFSPDERNPASGERRRRWPRVGREVEDGDARVGPEVGDGLQKAVAVGRSDENGRLRRHAE